jgi:hypothetical protein
MATLTIILAISMAWFAIPEVVSRLHGDEDDD